MEKKPTRYYSSKQEQKVADWLDGALTINSGASYKKGDILLKDTIVECKTKTKQTISPNTFFIITLVPPRISIRSK